MRVGRVAAPPDDASARARARPRRYYSRAVPTDAALDAVAALGRVVQVGAGSGYWAALLAARGADVVAYDASPPRDTSWRHFAVAKGGGPEVLRAGCADRALLLVCPAFPLDADGDDADADVGPRPREPADAAALRTYRGATVAHVGALSAPGRPSPNTSPAFERLVRDGWTVARRLAPLVELSSRHATDALTIWTRAAHE